MDRLLIFAWIVVFIISYNMHLRQHEQDKAVPVKSAELVEFMVDCELKGLKVIEIDELTVSCVP